MNILLGAYACEPNVGSEPEVGWQMANEIAKAMPNDTVYVITKENNKEAIEGQVYPENLKFYYYAVPKCLSFWKKGGRGIRTYYYLWMLGAAKYMKSQDVSFDVVHHVTFVNDWLPSFFSLLKNKNNIFIWGPIGSHDHIATKFLDGNKRKLIESVRILLQLFFRCFDPSFYYCKSKADCIIGINENVSKKLGLSKSSTFIAEPAIAMKKCAVVNIGKKNGSDSTFKIITVGRLLYIKNFKLSVLAFSKFLNDNPKITNAKLLVVGEGPDRKSLQLLVGNLGIEEYVEFTGKLALNEVLGLFSQADIFLFPTLENAGFVIIEAMTHSTPVVAMNYGGPQQFVKHHIEEQLVSAEQPYESIIKDLSVNLTRLYSDDNLRCSIGERNRKDVLENHTWEAKAQKIKKIYRELLNEN